MKDTKKTELFKTMGQWGDQKVKWIYLFHVRGCQNERTAYYSWKELHEYECSLAWITVLKKLLTNNSTKFRKSIIKLITRGCCYYQATSWDKKTSYHLTNLSGNFINLTEYSLSGQSAFVFRQNTLRFTKIGSGLWTAGILSA